MYESFNQNYVLQNNHPMYLLKNKMFIHCGLILLCLSWVRTTESVNDELRASDFNRFSLWPSVHNAATLLRLRRETPTETEVAGASEGVGVPPKQSDAVPSPSKPPAPSNATEEVNVPNTNMKPDTSPQVETPKVPGNKTDTATVAPTNNATALNVTSTEKPKALDLNNPGVVKRGIIVFGGFALMAVAYFIFYKRKNKNIDMNNSLGMNDANQFRYGVLQNEDMKDNLESTRIPLTMESEDEVDEDLEIFDLVQKKKSLSYVNLQQNDEDIVLSTREVDIEGDNLLLDIEDATSDTLINWSSSGSKSIL